MEKGVEKISYLDQSPSTEASLQFLQETNVAQRLAATERAVPARFSPSSEDDILVMSPISAWRQSGTFVDVPEVMTIAGKEYSSAKSQFVPDGGKYDPFEGIDVHKKLRLKDPPHSGSKELELHNPVYLSDAASRLFEKSGKKHLSKEWLDQAAKSTNSSFTERERAAADLLSHNYKLFSSLDAKDNISALDVSVLKDASWWSRVLAGSVPGQTNSQISDPNLLKGSAEPYKYSNSDRGVHNYERHIAEMQREDKAWARFNEGEMRRQERREASRNSRSPDEVTLRLLLAGSILGFGIARATRKR